MADLRSLLKRPICWLDDHDWGVGAKFDDGWSAICRRCRGVDDE